jgi:hypothetical protein
MVADKIPRVTGGIHWSYIEDLERSEAPYHLVHFIRVDCEQFVVLEVKI